MTPPSLIAVALASALAACAEPQLPTLRLLPEPSQPATPASMNDPVAVSIIAMPDYAQSTVIAIRDADGGLAQAPDQSWGDALSRAATRRLAAALTAQTGRLALAEPWPPEFTPRRRVDVIVDRFLGAVDGPTELSGEFRVADARGLRHVERFRIAVEAPSPGWDGLVEAHGQAIARLAERIAPRLGAAS